MKRIIILFSLCLTSFLAFTVAAQEKYVTEKTVEAATAVQCGSGLHAVRCSRTDLCCKNETGGGCNKDGYAYCNRGIASEKLSTTATNKIVIKGANEVNPLKLLSNPQGYIGSCGGCASNPTYCCPSTARPVCESSGSCYCWADPHCK
jgi:hypothetical protein